jgi:hypothetical protein
MVTDNNSLSATFSSLLRSFSSLTVPAPLATSLTVNSLTTLSLVGASGSLSGTLDNLINSFDTVSGTATLTDGVLTADLSTPLGPVQGSYNLVELGEIALDSFLGVAGILDLSGGVATGTINLGDGKGDRPGSVPFAELLSNTVAGFVSDFSGTIVLQNGKFLIDSPTPLGAIQGTIDFASGKLVSDLTTPFGDLDFAIDFPDTAKFDLPFGNGLNGVLNLDAGQIEVDLTALLPGPEIIVPLNLISGTLVVDQGTAIANLSTPFGGFRFGLDLAAEVRETVFDFLSTVSGTLAIGDGSLSANLSTDLGSFQGSLYLGQSITDFLATLPDYQGTLTFNSGTVTADLVTPESTLAGSFNYGQYLSGVVSLINSLD